jgi:hypothetical protein
LNNSYLPVRKELHHWWIIYIFLMTERLTVLAQHIAGKQQDKDPVKVITSSFDYLSLAEYLTAD